MRVNPLFSDFKTIVRPPVIVGSEPYCTTKSLGKRIYRAASVLISGSGNWSFYGVAASFGKKYSSGFGIFLGTSEFISYVIFRIRNFEQMRQQFVESDSQNEIAASARKEETPILSLPSEEEEKYQLLPSDSLKSDSVSPPHFFSHCKEIARKTTAAVLGIALQFPFMILAYKYNGRKWIYPVLTGACEGVFTILSLLTSFKFLQSKFQGKLDPELEKKREWFAKQIDCFLEELPLKYKDPDFVKEIDTIFNSNMTEEECGKALLSLVLKAKGLPEPQKGSWDSLWTPFAKGVGIFITLYLTFVNGAVSYKGVKDWKEDQEALAVLATIVVSLGNLKLLIDLCIGSAANFYEGLRDIMKGQYRIPLACAVSPVAWCLGRIASAFLSCTSFGTTAISASDYVPKGENLVWPSAPISAALLLGGDLNETSDSLILFAKSKTNATIRQFALLHKHLLFFKRKVQNAHPKTLRIFFAQFPGPEESRSGTQDDLTAPLVAKGIQTV